jgi:hypothetical protein
MGKGDESPCEKTMQRNFAGEPWSPTSNLKTPSTSFSKIQTFIKALRGW